MQELFAHPQKPGTLLFVAAFFGLSVLLLILLPTETAWVKRTKLFVQPRFWPGIAIICMLIFSAGYLILQLISPQKAGLHQEVMLWLRALEFAVWFLAYVWFVPQIGYLLATLVFTCSLTWRMGYRSCAWMGLAALFGLGTVVLFKGFLGVNIPAGAIYDALPSGALRSFLMTNF